MRKEPSQQFDHHSLHCRGSLPILGLPPGSQREISKSALPNGEEKSKQVGWRTDKLTCWMNEGFLENKPLIACDHTEFLLQVVSQNSC